MQYNISDSEILFSCFVLITLKMASLDALFLCSVGQQAWLYSQLFLIFFCKNQGFCSYKIVLLKKKKKSFSFNFTQRFSISDIEIIVHLVLPKSLFINWDTKRYWLTQKKCFFHPQDVELKFRQPMCFVLQSQKNCGLLLKPDLINSKITLIKTKGVVIYHV